jgi:two-component system response regulator HupR/HoxA
MDLINWPELTNLRVIRKLSEIIRSRWNLGIAFTDSEGNIRAVPEGTVYEFDREMCQLVANTKEGFDACCGTLRDVTLTLRDEHADQGDVPKPHWRTCHAGMIEVGVPIVIRGKFLGAVFVSGFIKKDAGEHQKDEVVSLVRRYGVDPEAAKKSIQAVPVLGEANLDYLTELIELIVEEIVSFQTELYKKERRITQLNKELVTRYQYGSIIGKSRSMQDVYRLLDKISGSESTVLIQGENGTGKELVAKAVHYNGPRKDKIFVVQNCSAFNDNLLDSELFGHVKGAFTGAVTDKKGLFEVADGGTFFLDEIGEMSPTLQVKLLRVLQEGTFLPVGGTKPRKVDVRIIAATNRDLKKMVSKGEFREDLYYRVNVINVFLPPLRERRDDIPVLVEAFLKRHAERKKMPEKQIGKRAMERLMDYDWPGNVRELENEIERLVVLAGDDPQINDDLLSQRIKTEIERDELIGKKMAGRLPDAVEALERKMIYEELKKTRWNKTKAADTLGISRRNLIRKVAKYNLDQRKNRGGMEPMAS